MKGNTNQPFNDLSITFFHLENRLYIFVLLINIPRNGVREIQSSGKYSPDKAAGVLNFFKWKHVLLMKRLFVSEILLVRLVYFDLNCQSKRCSYREQSLIFAQNV